MTEIRDRKMDKKLKAYYFQRRMLFGCTLSLVLAFVLWIIAISTEKWYIVHGGKGELKQKMTEKRVL